MEGGQNNSEANSEVMFSARDLAEMRLPGLPDTERAWLDRAKNGKWDFKEVPGRGRGGIKRIYAPPPEIRALIDARQRGELIKPAFNTPPLQTETPMVMYGKAGELHGGIDEILLTSCLSACGSVYGDEFTRFSVMQQIGYAVDFYNLLVRMCHSQGVAIGDMKRLETQGLAEQLGAFVKLGWARKFPPPAPLPKKDYFF
ncbi:MAG: hypothetical protein PHD37_17620 [Gallionellaceae bacterium]|nr:hypothetical protein [Gallionellaceae bacterium]